VQANAAASRSGANCLLVDQGFRWRIKQTEYSAIQKTVCGKKATVRRLP
jgi:hypothetical protein